MGGIKGFYRKGGHAMQSTSSILPAPVRHPGRRRVYRVLSALVTASSAGCIALLVIPAGILVALIALVWAAADKTLDRLEALEKPGQESHRKSSI